MEKPTFKEPSNSHRGKAGLQIEQRRHLKLRQTCLWPTAGCCTRLRIHCRGSSNASKVTAQGNLVAVSNGTAVLGLGPLARHQSLLWRQAVLMKKFSDIDTFDLEIDERDPEKLVNIIALEPTLRHRARHQST